MGIIDKKPSVVKTYHIDMEQMKELVALDLNVSAEEIEIDTVQKDISDSMDRYPCVKTTGFKVTHTPSKREESECNHTYRMVGHQFNGHYECTECKHIKML